MEGEEKEDQGGVLSLDRVCWGQFPSGGSNINKYLSSSLTSEE